MLTAVEAAFAQLAGEIDASEKSRIEEAVAEVRDALGTHEVRKLQNANRALDDATQGLAAAIVEKAMQS
jgi:CHASE3 domain sensor protein